MGNWDEPGRLAILPCCWWVDIFRNSGDFSIDLYHGAAILNFSHWYQCNQTEAGRTKQSGSYLKVIISNHYCYLIQGTWPRWRQPDKGLLQALNFSLQGAQQFCSIKGHPFELCIGHHSKSTGDHSNGCCGLIRVLRLGPSSTYMFPFAHFLGP